MMNAGASNFDPGGAVSQGYSNSNNPYDNSAGYYGQEMQPHQQQQIMYGTSDSNSVNNNHLYNTSGYAAAAHGAMGSEDIYYHQQQQEQQYSTDPNNMNIEGAYGAWQGQQLEAVNMQASAEPGHYYPLSPLMPQWGTAPVTAIAYDNAYGAVYIASPTLASGQGGGHSSTHHHHHHRVKQAKPDQTNYDRSAMISIHSTNPADNGMLYASVAGHPEASRDALMDIYSCMYGFSLTTANHNEASTRTSSSNSASTAKFGRARSSSIPSHAYKPVYGRTSNNAAAAMQGGSLSLSTAILGGSFASGKNAFHMGIQTLLPITGHVASVSPSAVRVHAKGGLQLADAALEGMLCGTLHPDPSNVDGLHQHGGEGATASHLVVGGIIHGTHQRHQLHCMDIWRGLQTVTSRKFHDKDHDASFPGVPLGVTALASSNVRGSVVAGCSDGKIRFLDGSLREVAKVSGHASGVNDIAVSEDGTLIATTGYGYRPTENTSLYSYPDPNVLVFDIRYLGRGGISHPFSGLHGGPRFLSFIPSVGTDQPADRLLVASGQSGGGMQIIIPFEPHHNDDPANFILPSLDRGEAISSMVVSEDNLALGTSQCRVLQYRMAGYTGEKQQSDAHGVVNSYNQFVPSSPTLSPVSASASSTKKKSKIQLSLPDFVPPLPPLSLDPTILQSDNRNARSGMDDRMKSIFTAYTLVGEPTLSSLAPSNFASFGPLVENVLLAPSRRKISSQLVAKADNKSAGDYLMTIPTKSLKLDILANHKSHKARLYRKPSREKAEQDPLRNPNKTIYSKKIAALCYEEGLNKRHLSPDDKSRSGKGSGTHAHQEETSQQDIPLRYRLTLRPRFKSGATFDHAEFNHTGLFPGWDYPPTMPNAFASPVLLLMYFSPALRTAIFAHQYNELLLPSRAPNDTSMIPELGFLFHQMESLSRIAYSHPTNLPFQCPRVRAWVPSNFLASLASMKEAVQLQILDGSPAAVALPRRPEAFYLFLLYQIDKELSKTSNSKLLDSFHGTDFLSVNEFITGSDVTSKSTARALTVELAYECFRGEKKCVRFGQILQRALCGETRLRAWNQSSKSYETIVQRKIATSLPRTLSLSCACAGRKEEDGLKRWRTTLGTEDHWLPEMIEVELEEGGGVIVRECQQANDNSWLSFGTSFSMPPSVSKLVLEKRADGANRKYRYRLDAVLSFVRGDLDSTSLEADGEDLGHHVLHMRVPNSYKKLLLSEQFKEVDGLAKTDWTESNMFVTEKNFDPETFQKRAESVQEKLDAVSDEDSDTATSWILANGYAVSETVIEDARAFHVAFKEPCLVVYNAVDHQSHDSRNGVDLEPSTSLSPEIPPGVMMTRSITDGRPPKHALNFCSLPDKGDLIAFDAEFVSVQEEESTLTKTGSKVTLREVRHAVARISVIDCKSRRIIIDDHVLPQEAVVDHLTRFSGIVAKDLDPTQSPHHLISTRSAYLKLRFLMERGCIFVGHGLSQDFLMVNLVVPNQQIIDTVEIFHQERMRYISLRFLANYVLGRDMQTDTHDSVEDALAAYEIYLKALDLKKNGTFGKTLNELYEYGRKTDWKLGVDASGK